MSEPDYAKLWDIRQGFSLSHAGESSDFHPVSLALSHFSCSLGRMRIRCSELEEGSLSLSHPSCSRLQLEKQLRVCNMVTGRWTFHPSSITGQLLRGGDRRTEEDCVDRTALLELQRWQWRYGLVHSNALFLYTKEQDLLSQDLWESCKSWALFFEQHWR